MDRAIVALRIGALSASGQLDSFATTTWPGTCTKTDWPKMPAAWYIGSPGSVTHQQLR
jgi:hypothetical protein